MARREDIVNTIWDELDHLSDDAVMLYIWSWTNTKCGMAGVYKVPRRKLLEGRLDGDRLDAALVELTTEGKLRYEEGVLWNCARVKRLSGISEQIAKSITKDLAEIDPSNPIVAAFLERYGKHPKLEPHLTLSRPSSDPHQNLDIEPDSRPSPEGHPTLPGRGRGQGQGNAGVGVGENSNGNSLVPTTNSLALRVQSILQGGVDGLSDNDKGRPWPDPKRPAIVRLVADCDPELAEAVARDVREIVQSQDRAPNITALFEQKLKAALVADSLGVA